MADNNILTVLITLITVAGSAGAWRFYESKLKFKHRLNEQSTKDNVLFREDLRERVANLESKLTEKEKEKEELQKQITELKTQLAEYKVRLEFLEKENKNLRKN
jgi:peptidoglycan hydrolase CwlO-like protein